MNKIKQLEIKKLLKELDYIESDFVYKNELVQEADNSFIRSVNELLLKHPDLKEIFDKKINSKIVILIVDIKFARFRIFLNISKI